MRRKILCVKQAVLYKAPIKQNLKTLHVLNKKFP